jgi:protein-disulfide isomerase
MEQARSALSLPVHRDDHSIGSHRAKTTLVVYGEFECPHCGRAHFHLKELRDRLDDLDARLVFRHFARDEIHAYSVRAAIAAEAAGEQGRFWEMHDHLFENQHSLEYEDLEQHADALGLDVPRFMRDIKEPRLRAKVEAGRASALESGLSSTPSFFLNGEPYEGGYEIDALIRVIGSATARANGRVA